MSCNNAILDSLTPIDFKNQFYRGFVYVDNWNVATTYNTGNQVFYDSNNKFYEAIQDGVIGGLPTDTANWKEISGTNLIADKDITNAYAEACVNFNPSLFGDDDNMKLAYLYLTAHFLVIDLNLNGLSSQGQGGLVNSRSVGSVSESYTIPDWQQKAIPSFYTKTNYGQKYWALILPRLAASTFTVKGATKP